MDEARLERVASASGKPRSMEAGIPSLCINAEGRRARIRVLSQCVHPYRLWNLWTDYLAPFMACSLPAHLFNINHRLTSLCTMEHAISTGLL